MIISKYRITLKHDNGVSRITLAASSSEAAKQMAMVSEGCPSNSIVSVEYVKTIYKSAV